MIRNNGKKQTIKDVLFFQLNEAVVGESKQIFTV